MSNDKNEMFDDVEIKIDDDNELEFDESDFEDDVDDDEIDDSEISLDDEDIENINISLTDEDFDDDDIDEDDVDMPEEDLSVFDIDVDIDDEDDDEEDSLDDLDDDGEAKSENNDEKKSDEEKDSEDEKKAIVPVEGEASENESKENANSDEKALDNSSENTSESTEEKPKKKKKGLIIALSILGVLLLTVGFFLGTTPGRKMIYSFAAKYIHGNVDFVEGKKNDINVFVLKVPTPTPIVTQSPDNTTPTPTGTVEVPIDVVDDEVYAKNYLLFGIEEIGGAANTDSIMVLTINKRDKSLKFTSLLRDTYVDIPGSNPNKINAAYAFGMKTGDTVSEMKYYGGMKLIEVIENTYDLKIEGFACVNFKALEAIIDRLGGVDIELGSSEASYLRRTNYISNPAYRTVQTGWNHLNGNQALGYCRVRKVVTLGGANNDYGRTVRQRRVIKAIVDAYTSQSLTDLLPVLSDCLQYVTTNMTAEQITDIFTDVVENKIFNFEENRIPYDGMFRDSSKAGIFNGRYNVTYALVIDDYRDQIIEKLHAFLYNDPTAVVPEEDENGEETDEEGLDSDSFNENTADITVVPTPAF